MEHVYDIHTLIKKPTLHAYQTLLFSVCQRMSRSWPRDNNSLFLVVDVWQANLVIKVGIIKIMLNIREKMYYINVIYSIQIYVYVFYKALCQAWLLYKVDIIGTK